MMRKKLGEMLIEAGVIDELSLRSALADQRRWGRTLGRTLVEMKLVEEPVLVEVLGKQLNCDCIDLDQLSVSPDVLKLVPPELARQAHIMPFRTIMKFLDIAMGDPTNLGLVDELRIRTQLNIRPFLCGPRQIERNIAKYYGDGSKAEIVIPFDSPDSIELHQPAPVATPRTATRQPASTNAPANVPRTPSSDGIRPFPRTMPPPAADAPASVIRDAEINALQVRISKLEALVERDEAVLKRLLALLIEKGVATREEIVERLS
jgi:type IV pilus assembly protein PilB